MNIEKGVLFMTNEEFQRLVLEQLSTINNHIGTIEQEIGEIKLSQVRMEQEHGKKIDALFDGYALRGDQIEQLQDHIDERLDTIQTDLSYVVSKVAQHDRNIVRLNKIAK
jgi:hypothetical protein